MNRSEQGNLRYQIRSRSFYNQERKKEYLAYLSDRGTPVVEIIQTEKTFQYLRKTEEEYDRDACTFSREEAEIAFNRFFGRRSITDAKFTLINRVRRYVRWCQKSGVEGACDGFFAFTPDKDAYKSSKVVNPNNLARVLRDFSTVADEDDAANGPYFRLCVWMLYAGMTPEEIDLFRGDHVSVSALLISIDSYRQFRLESECLDDLVAVLANESDARPTLLPASAVKLVRPSSWYLTVAGNAAKKQIPFDFYPQNVLLCGLFYRMWKNESFQSGSLDFDVIAEEAAGMGVTFPAGRKQSEFFREQYERWKCAYGLL